MAPGAEHLDSARREVVRWGGCFLLAILMHGGGALALFVERDRGEVTDSIPAVLMDFAALPTPEAPLRDIAPGIEQVQTEAAPTPSEAKPDPVQEVQAEKPIPVRVSELHVQETTEVKPVQEDPVPIRELPPVPDAEVALATTVPPPPAQEVVEKKEESEEKSDVQPAPPLATAPETTAPTSAAMNTASLVSWKVRLASHLQRFKRYPPAAAARGQHGTAELRFTVDRAGHVRSAVLVHGSGHALLDEETLALIHRAQPLPRPPGDVHGADFTFTVPVRFNAK
jgi:periplasmic protein TonB